MGLSDTVTRTRLVSTLIQLSYNLHHQGRCCLLQWWVERTCGVEPTLPVCDRAAGGLLSGALFQYPGAIIMTAVGVFAANLLANPSGALNGVASGVVWCAMLHSIRVEGSGRTCGC